MIFFIHRIIIIIKMTNNNQDEYLFIKFLFIDKIIIIIKMIINNQDDYFCN